MAERDATLPDKFSNEEATEISVENEADSLLENSDLSRRDSNDLVTGDERRQSEDSVSKDTANFDSRSDSISDHILGKMGSYLEGSPNAEEDQDEDAIGDKQEDDHEDILDVQAGDDQFEVLDSAGDTDNVENSEEVGKSTLEDEKRRSKSTKHSTEEHSHSRKESREPKEKEPSTKGIILRIVSN